MENSIVRRLASKFIKSEKQINHYTKLINLDDDELEWLKVNLDKFKAICNLCGGVNGCDFKVCEYGDDLIGIDINDVSKTVEVYMEEVE